MNIEDYDYREAQRRHAEYLERMNRRRNAIDWSFYIVSILAIAFTVWVVLAGEPWAFRVLDRWMQR